MSVRERRRPGTDHQYGRTFAEALGVKLPEPYPLTFPRILDFIPIHSLNATIDPAQEIFVYAGNVSVPLSSQPKRVQQNKDHTITISQSPINRLHTAVKYGHSNNEQTTTQEELWEDVQDIMGLDTEAESTIPELTIKLRGLRNEVPYEVSDHPDIEGMEYIYQIQGSRGNRTPSYRDRFGLTHIINPTYVIKNELIERGLWRKQYGGRLRSILRTETMLAGQGHKRIGWSELFKMPVAVVKGKKKHRFPPLAGSLNRALAMDKWHWDYGIPSALTGKINTWDVNAVVYMLSKRHAVSVI